MESEQKANKNRTKANKMRTVTQRVQHASVTIDGQLKSKIGKGLLVLVGIEDKDTQEDIEWLAKKITNLRIFDDENGVMNRSVIEAGGEIMVVSPPAPLPPPWPAWPAPAPGACTPRVP